MTVEYFFSQIHVPIHWKRMGTNTIKDLDLYENERILSVGSVYDNRKNLIIKIAFVFSNEKGSIIERSYKNGEWKYKTVLGNAIPEDINNYIKKYYC